MDLTLAAQAFAELGHEKRLMIIRLLIQAEPKGLTMGEISQQAQIPDSTLTHHITKLERAELISRQAESQILRCRINIVTIRKLADFLLKECCKDHNQTC